MFRLSRLTVVLLMGAALLSAVSEWDYLNETQGTSPLTRVASYFVPSLGEDRRALDARMSILVERSRKFDHLAEEVSAGRMALFDGAARLREVCRATPNFAWERFRESHRGQTDDERFCRMLIGRVGSLLLPRDADQAQAVVDRLETELEEHLKHGPLHLPEV
jgi:hypothetical protein